MDVTLILVAFGLGFAAVAVNLPPLVGFLAAGFILHAAGHAPSAAVDAVADLGVYLLLFGIGLKLRLRSLAKPIVWATAAVHLAVTSGLMAGVMIAVGALGLSIAAGLSPSEALLIGFALSFSSTIFAVKALEERNESASLQGRLSIGILVVQDIVAVVFLTLSADTTPSVWAVPVVLAVVAARPLYGWVLDRSGHGELLVLFGFCAAVGVGAEVFAQVGLKPDLGALVVGAALAGHRRAPELADRLLGYKDLLLVGFFLSIGLDGAPGPEAIVVAAIALVLLPLKTAAFVGLLSRFRVRTRTAWHASVTLTTFSEFGLIVAAVAIDNGVVDQQWASAIAVAVALSFVATSPLNTARYLIYDRFVRWAQRIERHPIRPEDAIFEPGSARVLVFGMGRVGAGAYDELVRRLGRVVLGIDRSEDSVAANVAVGRRVLRGDAMDTDFWDRIALRAGVDLVVLAMSDHQANLETARRVRRYLPDVRIAGSGRYADEVEELRRTGVDVARNLYGEAGQGLADDACDLLGATDPDL